MIAWLKRIWAWFVQWWTGQGTAKPPASKKPTVGPTPKLNMESEEPPRFALRGSLLTEPEKRFYYALLSAATKDQRVFAKVRLGDVFYLANEPKNRWQHLQPIYSKHFDFLICDATYHPLLAVELDDTSHRQHDNQRSDAMKNGLCESVGFPLLRVPIQRRYMPEQIAAEITHALQAETFVVQARFNALAPVPENAAATVSDDSFLP